MPFTPGGHIEVWEPGSEPGRGSWREPVSVLVLMTGAWDINPEKHYDLFGPLFGYPAPGGWESFEEENPTPLAMERGLPNDLSTLVRHWYEGCGRTQGETWISWTELKTLDLAEISARTGKQILKEWWILFEIMTTLAKWYDEDKMRFVLYWSK